MKRYSCTDVRLLPTGSRGGIPVLKRKDKASRSNDYQYPNIINNLGRDLIFFRTTEYNCMHNESIFTKKSSIRYCIKKKLTFYSNLNNEKYVLLDHRYIKLGEY